jgi:hypothetical protein
MDSIVAAASAALGATLTCPLDLGGSERSMVLRCDASSGGSVVVKSYPPTPQGARDFAAEASGLAFTAAADVGPRLLGTDPAVPLIVMTDLGDAPSLADLLLGESADAARAALLSWALACGRLAARTAGQQGQLERLRAAQPGGAGALGDTHWLAERILSASGLLGGLDIRPPAGLADDLASVAAILEPGAYKVFSPGDICPDNNLLTSSGLRFIDYESAEFHSVFLDAAYLRMPFSTCWCVFRLPGDLAEAAEAVYRAEVCGVFPDLASDAVWRPGVVRAVAAWTIHAMSYLLDRSIVADKPMHDSRTPVPTARQLLRYRWHTLRDELDCAGELPALAGLARDLLAATEHWKAPELPAYPAFRGGPARTIRA